MERLVSDIFSISGSLLHPFYSFSLSACVAFSLFFPCFLSTSLFFLCIHQCKMLGLTELKYSYRVRLTHLFTSFFLYDSFLDLRTAMASVVTSSLGLPKSLSILSQVAAQKEAADSGGPCQVSGAGVSAFSIISSYQKY